MIEGPAIAGTIVRIVKGVESPFSDINHFIGMRAVIQGEAVQPQDSKQEPLIMVQIDRQYGPSFWVSRDMVEREQ
jgi:hypothetical protein